MIRCKHLVLGLALCTAVACSSTEPNAVNSVTVSAPAAEIQAGGQMTLSVAVSASGAPASVVWVSSQPTNATVDAAGTVTAIRPSQGVGICAVSTFDSAKKGCVSLAVFTPRLVRYWLRVPANANVPGIGAVTLTYGQSVSYRSYGTDLSVSLVPVLYVDGTTVPSDLTSPICLFLAGTCDITAGLIIDYYSADVTNQTSATLYVQARRASATADPVYTCITSVPTGQTVGLPYYEYFFGNPYAGELRVFAGKGCTGGYYDVAIHAINYTSNPSGYVTVPLTVTP